MQSFTGWLYLQPLWGTATSVQVCRLPRELFPRKRTTTIAKLQIADHNLPFALNRCLESVERNDGSCNTTTTSVFLVASQMMGQN
jgi:hypothetical protein